MHSIHLRSKVKKRTQRAEQAWLFGAEGNASSQGKRRSQKKTTISNRRFHRIFSLALSQSLFLSQPAKCRSEYHKKTCGLRTENILTDSSTLQNSPKYIAAKHFFRYIRPNSICVNAPVTGSTTLTASAFLQTTNGTMTIVLVNSTNTAAQAIINSPAQPAGITSWQTFTSSDGSYWNISTNTITNGMATVGVPGYGVVTLYGVAPPTLSAATTANGQITLFWPPSANGFLLQSTKSLASPSAWTNVADGQIISNGVLNGLVSVTLAASGAGAFYRLAQP